MKQAAIDESMARGLQCHQAGQLAQAAAVYRQVLEKQPRHSEALRLLGMVARNEGRLDEAVDLIQKSIAIDPSRAEAHHNLGDALWGQGKLEAAAAAYTKSCQLRPDWAEAHGALGNVLRDQGKLDQAAAAYTKAIQLKPALPVGYLNLGRVLHEQGKRGEAIAAFLKAIDLKPDWPEAHNKLGNVLWDEGKLDQALAAYAKAIELHPSHPAAHWSMAKILLLQNRLDPAIACFQKAVQLNPGNAKANFNLGDALIKAGRLDEARTAFAAAIELEPDSPKGRFRLAALSGDGSATTAPTHYILDLFDRYAPTFEKHLVEQLGYQVPQQLLQLILTATPQRNLDILDLGCGTGLCGQQLRPYARRLVGVDLAPAMIKSAAARQIYDQLLTEDLMSALGTQPNCFDLIVAGDVLIYVGDLSRLMPAVAASLRMGGLFAFSIENHDGPGYFLHSEERFAHSMSYIREQAALAHLQEVSSQQTVLRKQAGIEACGWLIVLRKADVPAPSPSARMEPS
jgi:predicted TPR repeat methyltransferase